MCFDWCKDLVEDFLKEVRYSLASLVEWKKGTQNLSEIDPEGVMQAYEVSIG